MAACADVASDGEPSVGELRADVAVQELVGDVVLLASRGLSRARQPADGHRDRRQAAPVGGADAGISSTGSSTRSRSS